MSREVGPARGERVYVIVLMAVAISGCLLTVQSSSAAQSGDGASTIAVARRLRGGDIRLGDVKSLIIRGMKRSPDGSAALLTYKLLLPGHFQETADGRTFTIKPGAYWQRPDPGETAKASAKRNKAGAFMEITLLFLLRTPDRQGTVSLPESTTGRVLVAVTGLDGLARTLVFSNVDQSLVGIDHHARIDQGGVSGPAVRQLSILSYQEIAGIRFPSEWLERFATVENKISIFEVVVNPPLSPSDFDEPTGVPTGPVKGARILVQSDEPPTSRQIR